MWTDEAYFTYDGVFIHNSQPWTWNPHAVRQHEYQGSFRDGVRPGIVGDIVC
jgi:hypothetical protein